MISEGSRDSENWSNDGFAPQEKYILKYIKNRKQFFQIIIIFHNITILLYFCLK